MQCVFSIARHDQRYEQRMSGILAKEQTGKPWTIRMNEEDVCPMEVC